MNRFAVFLAPLLLVNCTTFTQEVLDPVALSFSDGSLGTCLLENKYSSEIVAMPSTAIMRRSHEPLTYECNTRDGRKVQGKISRNDDSDDTETTEAIDWLDFESVRNAASDFMNNALDTAPKPYPESAIIELS